MTKEDWLERQSAWCEQIDERLHTIIAESHYPPEFKSILEYALFPAGKRLRPILFLEWYNMYAPCDRNAINMSCAFELMHSYSLIHDDMPCADNDDLRRGKLTVHKMFGEGKALLAGDALLNMAYQVAFLAGSESNNVLSVFAESGGDFGLVNGQYRDLYSEIDSVENLLKMYGYKTGALISAACQAGSSMATNSLNTPSELFYELKQEVYHMHAKEFGDAFGIAFQLYDDISEYVAGESVGESSILKFLDLEESKRLLHEYLNRALAALSFGIHIDSSYLKKLVETFIIV